MDDTAAEAYLARIGATSPARVDPAGLTDLMRRHLLTVAFENLSIHLGEPISLDEAALLDKVVGRRRGGFCYELNGAFAVLLDHLGYDVTLLAARVYGDQGPGPLFDHLTLRVDLDEPWLVDVGFGRFVAEPVRLDVRIEQRDPAGTVRVSDTEEGDLDVEFEGQKQLRIEQRPRELADFGPTCWYQQTSPASHFTQSLTCSLPTVSGRVTLSDRLLITTVDGERTETELGSDAEVLAAYVEHFGIVLDRLPTAP
ncbi:MAG: arylamine N-acetyltransferase, partial [Marmoricola sp.]